MLDREELTREVVETAALRRSDELKTAILRAVSHDLRSPLTAMVAAGEALGSPDLPRRRPARARRRDRRRGRAPDPARREAARPLAAAGRDGDAAARLVLARGGAPRRRRGHRREALDRSGPAADRRRLRAARARVRQPAGERAAPLRRPARLGARAGDRRPPARARRRPGTGHRAAEQERIFEPFYGTTGLRPRPGDRQGLRRGQRRPRARRVAARPGRDVRRRVPASVAAPV